MEAALAQAAAEQRLAQLQAEENERVRANAQIDALPEERRQTLFNQAKAQLLVSYPGMALFLSHIRGRHQRWRGSWQDAPVSSAWFPAD